LTEEEIVAYFCYGLIFMHCIERINDYGKGNNMKNTVIHNKNINNINYKIEILSISP
jgi:hypothetical protein